MRRSRASTRSSTPLLLLGPALGALLLAALPLAVLGRRMRRRPLAGDEQGAAAAVDFVLTLPIFMVFVSLAVIRLARREQEAGGT